MSEKVLSKVDVTPDTATFLDATAMSAAEGLLRGDSDAAILMSDFEAPAVQALLRDATIKLLDVSAADAFTRIFPEFGRLVMPKGLLTIEPPRPASDVKLLAATNRVLIRDDLHPAIVHLLLEAMVETHGGSGVFQRAGEFPQGADAAYPVASSAADFYQNDPTFMQRTLPLWLTPLVQGAIALLLTIAAIAIPLLTTAPKIFRWLVRERIVKLYQRLRAIDDEVACDPTAERLAEMQSEVAAIERDCASLPLPVRYADMYFTFTMHTALVRSRLSCRLDGLGERNGQQRSS